jgi:predicted Holliday junction resolvase-like endonuclease
MERGTLGYGTVLMQRLSSLSVHIWHRTQSTTEQQQKSETNVCREKITPNRLRMIEEYDKRLATRMDDLNRRKQDFTGDENEWLDQLISEFNYQAREGMKSLAYLMVIGTNLNNQGDYMEAISYLKQAYFKF